MPVNYQLVPEHVYPSMIVQINDNTEVSEILSTANGATSILCVFSSPKGHDNVVQTIDSGLAGFKAEYGIGPFEQYGQPLLNAYNVAGSGAATLHCLRVMPADATYGGSVLAAGFKVADSKMTIKLESKTPTFTNLDDLSDDGVTLPDSPDAEGYTWVKLFTVAYEGRGVCGNNYRWRLTNNKSMDAENAYKNYSLSLYENDMGLKQIGDAFNGCFTESATQSGVSIFMDALLGNPDTGSMVVDFMSHSAGFAALFDAYKVMTPDTALTLETFDPLLGVDKHTGAAIAGLTFAIEGVEDAVAPNSLQGIPFAGGTDGALTYDATKQAAHQTALDALYLAAFSGETDPYIKSRRRYPTNIILDANFSIDIKKVMAQLALTRTDCVVLLDMGTGIKTKQSVLDQFAALDTVLTNRVQIVDAYCGKVLDPYSKKNITVTSTYSLGAAYAQWFTSQGKFKPMAGNNFGSISGYVNGSMYPVFDEDIDSEIMDKIAEKHINVLKIAPDQSIVRMTQDTRQAKKTVMSEANNVFVLLDIKRECEALCAAVEYNFNDSATMAFFASELETMTGRYQEAQVKSITAAFSANAWEVEHQCIHLNVAFVTKDIMKYALIEIDINR